MHDPLMFAPPFAPLPPTQVILECDEGGDLDGAAASQLQAAFSQAWPSLVPPLMDPVVVVGPFGRGKRGVLQALGRLLQGRLAAAPVVTSKERAEGEAHGEAGLACASIRARGVGFG